jgi:hypothetical protein
MHRNCRLQHDPEPKARETAPQPEEVVEEAINQDINF